MGARSHVIYDFRFTILDLGTSGLALAQKVYAQRKVVSNPRILGSSSISILNFYEITQN